MDVFDRNLSDNIGPLVHKVWLNRRFQHPRGKTGYANSFFFEKPSPEDKFFSYVYS